MKKTILSAISFILATGIILTLFAIPTFAEDVKYLSDMVGTKDENCLLYLNDKTEYGGKINVGGVEYEKGIITHPGPGGAGTVTFNIEGLGYTYFRAVVGKDKSAGSAVGEEVIMRSRINTQVYVNGVLAAESGILEYPNAYTYNVDITGAKELKIVSGDGGDSINCDATGWADARLLKLSVTGIEMATFPRSAYKVNEQLDITGANVKLTFSDGSTSVTKLTESMISGYDMTTAGKKMVTVTIKDKTCQFEIYVCDEAEYVTESMISKYTGYAENVAVNKNCDGTEINIAGTKYNSGFGIHPAADGSGSLIDLNVENCGYEYMTITCGKDLSCTNAFGIDTMLTQCAVSFNILADGVKVKDSGNAFYGSCFHYIVSLKGVKTVELKVNDVDGITCDASDWANIMMFNMPAEPATTTENPKTESPETGDNALLIVLATAFIIATVMIIFKKRALV